MKMFTKTILEQLVTKAVARDWLEGLEEISLQQLYCYALDRNAPGKERIRERVQNDEITRKRFVEILRHAKASEVAKECAIRVRGEKEAMSHCPLYQLKRSHDGPFVIDVGDGAPVPTRMFANSERFGCIENSLGHANERSICITSTCSDRLLKILSDPDCLILVW